MKCSSPCLDGIPSWFFRNCSYEIAHVVTHILNLSFTHGVISQRWRCAVVTPVTKVPKTTAISDFRPISVTPLLSRVAERILARKLLLSAIPTGMLADQSEFRPSGSTQCALINVLHHVTTMLENCDYVRCLMIDFSRAFDVVDHSILLAKLSQLELLECIQKWFVTFLVGRCQSVKTDCLFSSQQHINRGIVQGSGVGPMLYIVMECDLHTLSRNNIMFTYADDTNLLVPAYSDVSF